MKIGEVEIVTEYKDLVNKKIEKITGGERSELMFWFDDGSTAMLVPYNRSGYGTTLAGEDHDYWRNKSLVEKIMNPTILFTQKNSNISKSRISDGEENSNIECKRERIASPSIAYDDIPFYGLDDRFYKNNDCKCKKCKKRRAEKKRLRSHPWGEEATINVNGEEITAILSDGYKNYYLYRTNDRRKYLEYTDPSSGGVGYIAVPWEIVLCKEAVAWTFNINPNEYNITEES